MMKDFENEIELINSKIREDLMEALVTPNKMSHADIVDGVGQFWKPYNEEWVKDFENVGENYGVWKSEHIEDVIENMKSMAERLKNDVGWRKPNIVIIHPIVEFTIKRAIRQAELLLKGKTHKKKSFRSRINYKQKVKKKYQSDFIKRR